MRTNPNYLSKLSRPAPREEFLGYAFGIDATRQHLSETSIRHRPDRRNC